MNGLGDMKMSNLDKVIFIIGALLLGWLACGAARAQPVDVALVLTTDVSGSIEVAEYELQKKGIIDSLHDSRILEAIKKGPHGAIALMYVEFASDPKDVTGWHIIQSKKDIERFTAIMESTPRTAADWTGITDAIIFSVEQIVNCPCEPLRSIIDLSADGPNNHGSKIDDIPWERIKENQIKINGLAISNEFPEIVQYMNENVVNGFVFKVESFGDIFEAMFQKLILEIM